MVIHETVTALNYLQTLDWEWDKTE